MPAIAARHAAARLVRGAVGALVLARLSRGRERRAPLDPGDAGEVAPGSVSVVVPARDEAGRIGPCLAGLAGDPVLREVIVVDDESADATAEVAREAGAQVLSGAPPPPGWVGKPWALQQGLQAARGEWVLTLDADTRPGPGLAGALVARAIAEGDDVLTAGPRFDCRTVGERLLHPAMLTSLVLRFGPSDAAGHRPRPSRTVGNGQCLLARREALLGAGGFGAAAGHMTDDIALLRALAAAGWRVGFVDAAGALEVRMHESGREAWREWGRSLAMADVTPRAWLALDGLVVWTVQGLPLVRLALRRAGALDGLLLALRVALLAALAPSYTRRGPAYWLSPLADPVVAVRLTQAALRPPRTWRGRTYAGGRPATPARSAGR